MIIILLKYFEDSWWIRWTI